MSNSSQSSILSFFGNKSKEGEEAHSSENRRQRPSVSEDVSEKRQTPSQSVSKRHMSSDQASTNSKKSKSSFTRYYKEDYLQYGFTVDESGKIPLCLVCYKALSNEVFEALSI